MTALLAAITAASSARGASVHPQDGPHADLRFELRSDAFVADISMNLVFLDYVIDPHREQPDRIELSELKAMQAALTDRMAAVCRVTVDGTIVPPRLEALAMNDPDEALLPLFPLSGMRGLRKIRFELVHPISSPPGSISIVWSEFPPDELSTFEPRPLLTLAAELTAEGVRSQIEFRADEPEVTWHSTPGGMSARLLGVPRPAEPVTRSISLIALAAAAAALLTSWFALRSARRGARAAPHIVTTGVLVAAAVVCAAAVPLGRINVTDPFASRHGLPSDADARAIFEPLHVNLYRAFDFAEESAVYDALAESVDGPLLEQLYLTIHRSLVMQDEGGAISRVRAVRRTAVDIQSIGMLETVSAQGAAETALESPSFEVLCRYQVDGRVTHWGHSHDRTNEYLARYTVIATPAGWRIAAADVLEQTRIDEAAPRDDGSFDL
ncbi:MAG: hypothetical protein SGJ11_14535 [Phycisphaerae bacterium]|nr:hypothetical protein [Phycisphaerae bacterium]